MADKEEPREDDVEAHRRYAEEPPTEASDEFDRRRRAAEDGEGEGDDVETHRR